MSKRKSDENVDNLLKKIKKLEKKVRRKCRSRSLSVYSSTSSEHEEQPKTENSSASSASERLEGCTDAGRSVDSSMDTGGGPSAGTSSKGKVGTYFVSQLTESIFLK
ncbi:hypothetical protein evm_003666 [Chilo suppressalis]|nr:hypothetical protein evm_003666 [Chilo suppressalis]